MSTGFQVTVGVASVANFGSKSAEEAKENLQRKQCKLGGSAVGADAVPAGPVTTATDRLRRYDCGVKPVRRYSDALSVAAYGTYASRRTRNDGPHGRRRNGPRRSDGYEPHGNASSSYGPDGASWTAAWTSPWWADARYAAARNGSWSRTRFTSPRNGTSWANGSRRPSRTANARAEPDGNGQSDGSSDAYELRHGPDGWNGSSRTDTTRRNEPYGFDAGSANGWAESHGRHEPESIANGTDGWNVTDESATDEQQTRRKSHERWQHRKSNELDARYGIASRWPRTDAGQPNEHEWWPHQQWPDGTSNE